MSREKNILVTGGLGYIGSHTVAELLDSNYNMTIIDNLSNSKISVLDRLEKMHQKKINFQKIDISSEYQALSDLFSNNSFDVVIHFAALKSVEESIQNPLVYFDNNLSGLINLLKCCQIYKVKNMVFSSSCTVYGNPSEIPVSENSPTGSTTSVYGMTKLMNEEMLKATAAAENIKVIILRYFNPLGAHPSGNIGEDPINEPKNVLPVLMSSIKSNNEFYVFGNDYDTKDGTCVRDYIHVMDLADAHVKVMKLFESEFIYEVFNVGTGIGYTVLELISAFEKATNEKVNYKIIERRIGDIEKIWASTSKIEKRLNWKAKRNLDAMMISSWQFAKTKETIN